MNTEPQSELEFQEFLKKLTSNIHTYLNKDSNRKVGFACFIFDAKDAVAQASIISNCETRVFFPLLRRFTSRLNRKKRKMDA